MPIVILSTMPTKAPYIQCSVLDHEILWAFLGFCIGGKPRDVHSHWSKPNSTLIVSSHVAEMGTCLS